MSDNAFPSVSSSQQHSFQILRPAPNYRRDIPRPNPNSVPIKGPLSTEDKKNAKLRAGSYQALGLSSAICSALQSAGYNFPTPIQRKVIPPALAGDDIVAMARTGSGKTAAFLAPLLHRLSENKQSMTSSSRHNGPRALVIAPTRELVLQEIKFCNLYAKRISNPRLRFAVVVGGTPLEAQFEALAVCPDIIFATPGRLLQIAAEMRAGAKGGLTLGTTETLILDEADRLFEGTLAVETARLLNELKDKRTEGQVSNDRQTILVSATMPHALVEFSKMGLRSRCLKVVRLDADKIMSPTVAVSFLNVRAELEKDASLAVVLRRDVIDEGKCAVVFAATHRRVEYLVELLRRRRCCVVPGLDNKESDDDSYGVGCVHGGMDQVARQETVAKFRKKKLKVMVVTDVAARGIDLPDLDTVINYDMPCNPKLFIHRVGRVGRAGRFGTAVNLVSADELPYMLDIFLYLGRPVKISAPQKDEENEKLGSQVKCMESSFVLGVLPKAVVDEEVEMTKVVVDEVELEKMQISATNAHKLYIKTRGTAGGESVRRAKELFNLDIDGDDFGGGLARGKKAVHVHPWFNDMEGVLEREATEQVSKLSSWRPRECAVSAPSRIIARKEMLRKASANNSSNRNHLQIGNQEEDEVKKDVNGKDGDDDSDEMDVDTNEQSKTPSSSTENDSNNVIKNKKRSDSNGKAGKISARQAALEEERRRFFMPTQIDANQRRDEHVMRIQYGTVGSRNSRHDQNNELGAYRELHDAAMDVTADGNVDLLRAKNTGGGSSAKYWDRVSKKYIKGGVTDATSKRNMHVASREAKARANGGKKYGTEDGVLYKKWLSKNRKAVDQLAERVDGEGGEGGSKLETGLGGNDFRQGAFGRKARVAAAGKRKAATGSGGGLRDGFRGGLRDGLRGGLRGPVGRRMELKSVEEIKKERKVKAKAEARRTGQNKKGRNNKKEQSYNAPQRGVSKSRILIRRNK